MAFKRLTIDGYGQLEINNCAFRRDGRIEAQCAPDTSDFGAGKYLENGAVYAIDSVARKVKLPTGSDKFVAINYSAEHIYEAATGLKNFKLNPTGDFLPRLGYLAVGDKYTTNTVSYDNGEFANDAALISALEAVDSSPLYATIATNDGSHLISATEDTEAALQMIVVKKTTMPDGQLGVQFQVYSV